MCVCVAERDLEKDPIQLIQAFLHCVHYIAQLHLYTGPVLTCKVTSCVTRKREHGCSMPWWGSGHMEQTLVRREEEERQCKTR